MKKKPVVLGLTIIAMTALLVGWLSSRNSLFMLSEIVVKAENPDLERALQADLVALLGRRLTSLSLGQVEKILEKNPQVRRAVFHKRWPSTLEVAVEERHPVAVAFVDSKLWWVDEDGETISPFQQPTPLVLIKSFKKFRGSPEMKSICQWLAKQRKNLWVDEVEWTVDRGLVARNVASAQEIELGFQAFDTTWKQAEIALKFLNERNVVASHIDASYEHRVVVRLQGDLRNFENGLNLKELVRRTGKSPAAAR